jgi:hypothetical protein
MQRFASLSSVFRQKCELRSSFGSFSFQKFQQTLGVQQTVETLDFSSVKNFEIRTRVNKKTVETMRIKQLSVVQMQKLICHATSKQAGSSCSSQTQCAEQRNK